eukprot:m51a1_g1567 hypothetical protein (660) ;mRNA; r:62556-64590
MHAARSPPPARPCPASPCGSNHFSCLPADVFARVASLLGPRALSCFARTCTSLRAACAAPALWASVAVANTAESLRSFAASPASAACRRLVVRPSTVALPAADASLTLAATLAAPGSALAAGLRELRVKPMGIWQGAFAFGPAALHELAKLSALEVVDICTNADAGPAMYEFCRLRGHLLRDFSIEGIVASGTAVRGLADAATESGPLQRLERIHFTSIAAEDLGVLLAACCGVPSLPALRELSAVEALGSAAGGLSRGTTRPEVLARESLLALALASACPALRSLAAAPVFHPELFSVCRSLEKLRSPCDCRGLVAHAVPAFAPRAPLAALTELELPECTCKPDTCSPCAPRLAELLSLCPRLRAVRFLVALDSRLLITADVAARLAQLSALQKLAFRGDGWSVIGPGAIAELTASRARLRTLDVGFCEGASGLLALPLCSALAKFKSLQCVRHRDVLTLANVCSRTLRSAAFPVTPAKGCEDSPSVLLAVNDLLRSCKGLRTLGLSGCTVHDLACVMSFDVFNAPAGSESPCALCASVNAAHDLREKDTCCVASSRCYLSKLMVNFTQYHRKAFPSRLFRALQDAARVGALEVCVDDERTLKSVGPRISEALPRSCRKVKVVFDCDVEIDDTPLRAIAQAVHERHRATRLRIVPLFY